MTVALKVRRQGVVILPKSPEEQACTRKGSTVVAIAFEDGIVLSPKEADILGKLVGLAKISVRAQPNSVGRIRILRAKIDEGQGRAG